MDLQITPNLPFFHELPSVLSADRGRPVGFHARPKPIKLKLKPKGIKKNHPEQPEIQTTQPAPASEDLRPDRPRV